MTDLSPDSLEIQAMKRFDQGRAHLLNGDRAGFLSCTDEAIWLATQHGNADLARKLRYDQLAFWLELEPSGEALEAIRKEAKEVRRGGALLPVPLLVLEAKYWRIHGDLDQAKSLLKAAYDLASVSPLERHSILATDQQRVRAVVAAMHILGAHLTKAA